MTTIEKSILEIIEKMNKNGQQPQQSERLPRLPPLKMDELRVIKGGKYSPKKEEDKQST